MAQPVLEPTTAPFEERLIDRVPVGGRVLVGLLSVSNQQPPDGTGLLPGSIALPSSLTVAGLAICVRATTQDGRYSAENTFESSRTLQKGGRANLDWPTKWGDTLRTFPLREVAAVARAGSCAEQAEIIPLIVGEGDGLGTLQVLVNTRGAAVTAALRDPESGRTLRRSNCTRVAGSARVAFDARCVLGPATELPSRVQLRLEQVSHDGLQTEVLESLILRLGD
jgi:hypothetical protein